MIYNEDAVKWAKSMPDNYVDHIITDYEYQTDFPFEEFTRICRGTIITFCSETDNPFRDNITERAYWIKTPSTKNYTKHLGRFVEHIHIFRRDVYDIFNTNLHWSNYTGVYTDMVEDKGWLWRKPLSLMERLVRIYTAPNDLVLDPYMGSGTTLRACKNHGRRFIGLDKDPVWYKYCKENVDDGSICS